MRIMASQLTKRVESIKLPDGRYTQSGRDSVGVRVYFSGYTGEEVTLEEQGKPNLRAFAAHTED
jgi:hypothetical protein